MYNSTCVFTNGKEPCIYTRSNKFSNKLLFRDQWLSPSTCNADTRHLVGVSSTFEVPMPTILLFLFSLYLSLAPYTNMIAHLVQDMEPCGSVGLQQAPSHEMSCPTPSLEFTLGRSNWNGAEHD